MVNRWADRFDLTLECIRRHYLGQRSPLGETLARYRDFFALFEDFSGYVEFFMVFLECTHVVLAGRAFMNCSPRLGKRMTPEV